MIIVAIDPGVKGAVSIVDTYKFRNTYSIPLVHNTLTDIYLYLSEIRGGGVYRRAKSLSDISQSIRKVSPKLPPVTSDPLRPVDADDNAMEIWLEEPGQIVVNNRTKISNSVVVSNQSTGPKRKDSTDALLAGMAASRKLGRSVGQWEGIAAALNTPVTLVPPKQWQKALGISTSSDESTSRKNILKNAAISIFPHLTNSGGQSTITLDVADSLLIGVYAYMQYTPCKYWTTQLKSYLKSSGISFPH